MSLPLPQDRQIVQVLANVLCGCRGIALLCEEPKSPPSCCLDELHQGIQQVRLFTARPRAAAGMPEPDWAAVTRAAADALGPAAG